MRRKLQSEKTTWQLLKKLKRFWFKKWVEFLDRWERKPSKASKGRRKKGKPGRPRKHKKKYKAVQIIVLPSEFIKR
jgi:hypothetical protein